MAASETTTPAPRAVVEWLSRYWRRALVVLVLLGATLLLSLSLVFKFLVWPSIAAVLTDPQARAEWVAENVSVPGRQLVVDGLSVGWSDWFSPSVEIARLEWQDSDGQSLASLKNVSAVFGVRSLLSLWFEMPVFSKLHVQNVALVLERKDGFWLLAGFATQSDTPTSPKAFDWLSHQGPLSLDAITLDWRVKESSPSVRDSEGKIELGAMRFRAGITGSDLEVQSLPLAQLRGLLAWVMPDPDPSGRLSRLVLHWPRGLDALVRTESHAILSTLELQAQLESVGWQFSGGQRLSGLSARLNWKGRSGEVRLDSESLVLESKWFHRTDPMALGRVQGDLVWAGLELESSPTHPLLLKSLVVDFNRLSAQAPGHAIAASGHWRYEGQGLGDMRAQGTIRDLLPDQLSNWMPRVVGIHTRDWIARAPRGGRPLLGEFQINGPLAEFPFRGESAGQFSAKMRFEDLDLEFGRNWPFLNAKDLELRFEKARLSLQSEQSRIGVNPLVRVTGEIADVLDPHPILKMRGQFDSDLGGIIESFRATPLRNELGGLLLSASGGGPARLDLDLAIDLNKTDETKVLGRLEMMGSDLSLEGGIPDFQRLSGVIEFSEQSLLSLALKGGSLGGPVEIQSMPKPLDGPRATALRATGTAKAAGIESWMAEALDLPLKGALSGETAYEVDFLARGGLTSLDVRSSMRGLAVGLPRPARKLATQDWGMRVRMSQTRQANGSRLARWALQSEGRQISGIIEQSLPGPASTGRIRGQLALGALAMEPRADGILVRLVSPTIDLGRWLSALDKHFDFNGSAGGVASGSGRRATEGLRGIELQTPSMELEGHRFSSVSGRADYQNGIWVIDLESQQAQGQLRWQPNLGADSKPAASRGALTAQFSRLWLTPSGAANLREDENEQDTASLTRLSEARRWPSIVLRVEDLRYGPKQLGSLNLDAAPSATESAWIVSRLALENKDAIVSGSGKWAAFPGASGNRNLSTAPSETSLSIDMSIRSSQGLLSRMGHPGLLRDTPGEVKGKLAWDGSPTDYKLSRLRGQLSLDLRQGQFLKAEPGLAKLISVLNLQSLPRRITLDFRDIFSAGFAYDRVRGDVEFSNGQAKTNNLRILGVQATVFLEGAVNLVGETQDMRVLVLPELNAGLASLGYALVNPAIGLGSFIAQYILRDPVRKILAYEYQVTGAWAEPNVVELKRRVVESGPTSEPAK